MAMCITDVYGIWNGGVAHHIWDVEVPVYQVGLEVSDIHWNFSIAILAVIEQ